MAKQFAGDHAGMEGGTVDRDHQVLAPRTQLVNGAGDQLLAGAGFAQNQHGAVGVGHLLNRLTHPLHGLAVAGERPQIALGLVLIAQVAHALLKTLQLRHAPFEPGDDSVSIATTLAEWIHIGG